MLCGETVSVREHVSTSISDEVNLGTEKLNTSSVELLHKQDFFTGDNSSNFDKKKSLSTSPIPIKKSCAWNNRRQKFKCTISKLHFCNFFKMQFPVLNAFPNLLTQGPRYSIGFLVLNLVRDHRLKISFFLASSAMKCGINKLYVTNLGGQLISARKYQGNPFFDTKFNYMDQLINSVFC